MKHKTINILTNGFNFIDFKAMDMFSCFLPFEFNYVADTFDTDSEHTQKSCD